MVQQVKDLMLSLKQLGSLLWLRFDPWPENFHKFWHSQKKKTKTKKKKENILLKSSKEPEQKTYRSDSFIQFTCFLLQSSLVLSLYDMLRQNTLYRMHTGFCFLFFLAASMTCGSSWAKD